jgi:HlyD family secretion protein
VSKPLRRWVFYSVLMIAAAAAVTVALMPTPIPVDTAAVVRGPLRVSIDEDGETRAHDRYTVAAPVAGRLERITLREGDRIARGQTVALLHLAPLDPRQKEEASARVRSAQALKREADERVERARADLEHASRERIRYQKLFEGKDVSAQDFEQRRTAEAVAEKELSAAQFRAQSAAEDVRVAEAALMSLDSSGSSGSQVVRVTAPATGRILQVAEKSERIVAAGTPLVILGDPKKLEVVVDVLSTDAVKIQRGMPVLLEGWGGPHALRAKVRTVEPYAFTKVSALGVEEQRVNVVADFVDPPGPLGDGYRVEARIIIWESPDVLKIPVGAIFRHGDEWAAFQMEAGRAVLRPLEIGRQNESEAQVLKGLHAGARVILHPPNELKPGDKVVSR